MTKMRIPVDFNSMTPDGKRVLINTHFHPDLLEQMFSDQEVVLYTPDDLEVDGYLEMDKDMDGKEWWYGVPDWSTRRDLSL